MTVTNAPPPASRAGSPCGACGTGIMHAPASSPQTLRCVRCGYGPGDRPTGTR